MAFEGPIEDRLAIQELVTAYGDAVTQRDADAWGANWAEDGFWSMPDFPGWEKITGRAAIVATWVDAMKGFPLNINLQTLGNLKVDGDRAVGRTYTSELVAEPDGEPYRVTGQYDDEFVKQDGRWLFQRRVFKVLHQG